MTLNLVRHPVGYTMEREVKSIELWRCVISECLATFLLIFLSCAVKLRWDTGLYTVGTSSSDVLYVALTFGLTYCALTQSFGHVSGGHFNPAVTLAATLTCKVSPLRGLLYMVAQCGGSIAGASLLYGVAPAEARGMLGVSTLNPILKPVQGFAIEFLLTFTFVFTFFATVDPKRRNHGNQAVPLGLTMVLVHLVGVKLTGCSCNPARSLGPAFLKNYWQHHWIYWAGPMGGGLLAGLLYQYIFDPTRTVTKSNKTPDAVYPEKLSLRQAETSYGFSRNTLPRAGSASGTHRVQGHENSAYDYTGSNRNSCTVRGSVRSVCARDSMICQPARLVEPTEGDLWTNHF